MAKSYRWMQFHPDDWLSEPTLRLVSHEAKGLWADMLCLMWNSPERGRLLMPNGKPYTNIQLAKCVGFVSCNADVTIDVTVKELIDAQVCDVTDGIIESRRMLREDRKKEKGNERVREYRKRQSFNVINDVTPLKRSVKRNVTPLEIDIEKEKDTNCESVTSVITEFAKLYKAYPKQENESAARAEYIEHCSGVNFDHDHVFKALELQKKKWKAEGTDLQFIPLLNNWIKNERWNDEIVIGKSAQNNADEPWFDPEDPEKVRSAKKIAWYEDRYKALKAAGAV